MSATSSPSALVVFESMFGNTARAAAAVARRLVVHDVKGPLADGERERATEYGARVAATCMADTAAPR